MLVYPPKMYWPTRTIVTVGPLLLHSEWKVDAAQPSSVARQQRFHLEDMVCSTGFNQSLNKDKNLLLFPTMADPDNPPKEECFFFF